MNRKNEYNLIVRREFLLEHHISLSSLFMIDTFSLETELMLRSPQIYKSFINQIKENFEA